MKFFKVITLIAVLFNLCACSTVSSNKTKKSFVWEVTKPSNKKGKVFLVGSMHIGKESLYPLADVFDESFDKSDYLVVEQHITPASLAVMQKICREQGFYTEGKTIENDVPPETLKKLKVLIKKYNLNYEVMKRAKLWFLMMTLENLITLKHGFNPKLGLEHYFLRKAAQAGKEVVDLETVEAQLNPLLKIPMKEQLIMLDELIKNEEKTDDIDAIIDAWKAGNKDDLYEIVFASTDKLPHFRKFIFDDRNKNMAKKIEPLMSTDKTYFVLVGSGHLVGKTGLLELLKGKGYKLKQL